MKLEKKIAIIVLQVALVPLVMMGIVTYLNLEGQVNAKTYTDLDAFANLRAHWLQDAIQNKIDSLSLLSNDPELIALFSNYTEQPIPIAQKKVQDYLSGELGVIKSIQKVFMVTPDGTVTVSTDRSLIGTNVGTEDYFKLGLLVNDASTLKKDGGGSLSQYLAGPIKVRGETVGVIVAVSDAHELISIVEEYSGLGNTGETILAKRVNGTSALFLTPTRFDPSAALTRIVQADQVDIPELHAIRGEESIFTNSVDYRGVKVFAVTRYISSVGWGLVVKIDQSEALSPVKKLGELFSLIVAIAGLFMVIIAVSISRSITKPINELTSFANRVAHEGGLQETLLASSKDEVGTLGRAFNRMLLKLQEANETLEDKVAERTANLVEKTRESEDSQKAAFNIASDLRDEEEKLFAEKIKAENLANDLKKFKLALDNTSDQVIITDVEGVVIYVNTAVVKITGYSPGEVVGKKAGTLWKMPMPLQYYQQLWHTVKDQKKTFIGEIQNKKKGGELYNAMISISPVLDEGGNIMFLVALERDITKEKEIDKAKSEFISLASHQMRTPLTAINWYTEMLLGGDAGELSSKQKDYFQAIYTAAQQMNEILKSFLHILRLETGVVAMNPVSVNLVDIVRAVIKESQLGIEKKHLHIVEQYQELLPSLKTDTELIRVALQNLISNAVKYTPDGGEVTIALDGVKQGEMVAGKMAGQDSILVSVRDTGIGISTKEHDKIFTKFFRAESAKRFDPNGNGLGLYMTNKMVDIIGGTIWFDSDEGKETVFYMLLPMEEKKLIQ